MRRSPGREPACTRAAITRTRSPTAPPTQHRVDGHRLQGPQAHATRGTARPISTTSRRPASATTGTSTSSGTTIQIRSALPAAAPCSTTRAPSGTRPWCRSWTRPRTSPPTNAKTMARKLAQALEKASLGGVHPRAGTPSGCALKNEGAGADHQHSAYHYLQKVKTENTANGVSCRPNYVLFLTDGRPAAATTAARTTTTARTPTARLAARGRPAPARRSQRRAVHVHAASAPRSTWSASPATLSNRLRPAVAEQHRQGRRHRAGLLRRRTRPTCTTRSASAIYDAVKGSYATSPIAVGADDSDRHDPHAPSCWTRARTSPAGRAT